MSKMNNVLDVLSLQKHMEQKKLKQLKPTDYSKKPKDICIVLRFLFECATKLRMNPLTAATAARIFHISMEKSDFEDEYLVATSSLFLASKLTGEPTKLRDVVNVIYVTMNRGAEVPERNEEFTAICQAILQTELIITRGNLNFDFNFDHPHKYLLYIMKTVQDFVGAEIWSTVPIAKLAMSLLQDFHHSPKIIQHKSIYIAVCCLSLALQAYGIFMPPSNDQDGNFWFSNLVSELTKDKHWEIIEDIMSVYQHEAQIDATNGS